MWVFAAVGFAGIVALIVLVTMLSDVGRAYKPAKVAGAKPETVFTLGQVGELGGTNLITIDVNASDRPGGSGSYSGRGEDKRNILLLDKRTGESRKLLPDNSRHIERNWFLPAQAGLVDPRGDPLLGSQPESDRDRPAAYYALAVGHGGQEALQDILVGSLAGGQSYVMNGIDGVDSVWMQTPTQVGFLVRERLALYYRIVDIPTLKVVRSKRVAID